MKEQVNYYTGRIFTKKVFSQNVQQVPTLARVTITDSAGSVKVSLASASIAADGTMSYEVTAAAAQGFAIGENFKLKWTYTVSSKTYEILDLFDVVYTTIGIEDLSDDDLLRFATYLRGVSGGISGKADSGTVSTLVDNDLEEDGAVPIKGGWLEITEGTNSGTKRRITAFTGHTVTVSPAFASAIDATSYYVVRPSFEPFIRQAWEDVENDLVNLGRRPSLLIDGDQVRALILTRAAMAVAFSAIKDPQDRWAFRYDKLKDDYARLISVKNFLYDENEDANISSAEGSGIAQIKAVR
jgi:hypothetical protein